MNDPQPTPISDQLKTLDIIDSSYDKRKAIDDLDQNIPYSVSMVIDKIAKNYSYVREDGYRDAYYITGAISNSKYQVKVLLPTTMNSEVESWNEGETINLEAFISDWDLAYKRFGLLGRRSIVSKTEVDSVLDAVEESTPDSAVEMTDPTDANEPTHANDATDASDALTGNADSVADKVEPDTQSEGSSKQDHANEPVEQPIVDEVKMEQAELESIAGPPDELVDATPANHEIEEFIEQMEAPTTLEQLAAEYADTQPSNSDDAISTKVAIPVLGNVPTLKNVPTREAASIAPTAKRFSNHVPVRPTRLPIEVQEDETQDQAKKIIKITACICVGIILLMCLCCGIFSQ
jgi:hypothetical protein